MKNLNYGFIFVYELSFLLTDCMPKLQMMYAGSYQHLVQVCQISKVFQIRDLEDFDDDWISSNLGA